MSAGVTTTHDKHPPFTRAELQALRDRAEWIGAQLIDPHAARAHLDLAQAADHMDAIQARAAVRADLKVYDPNADTEVWTEGPGGDATHFAGIEGRAMPASEVRPKPPLGVYPAFLWREDHPNPSAEERAARRQDVRAAIERYKAVGLEPRGDWFDELEALARSEPAVPPHPEGGIDTGRRLGVLRALHRYHDLIVSQNGLPGGLKAIAARLIHSELASVAVKMSPNPVDDVVLEMLRALVPKPA